MVIVVSDAHEHETLPIVKWIPTPLPHALRSMREMRLNALIPSELIHHTQLRLGVRFTDKVLSECGRLGISLQAETHDIDLPSLMREASMELGIHNHDDIERISRWAYSWFIRATALRIGR